MAEKKKKTLEPVSDRRSIVYELIRGLVHIVLHTVMPVRCIHRERLIREGAYVLIANHRHALDPVAMAMFIPKRQVVFLAKKEIGKNKLVNRLLTGAHVIFVGRHEADMTAMRNCMKAIKMEKILLIFPEGSRHHKGQMEEIENGASLIAMRSKAPIIPVYISSNLGFFKRTDLYAGEPIPYDDLLERGINAETCEEMNERFRATFRKMAAEAEEAGQKEK